MIIYDKNGAQLADIAVNDESYRHREIMGENTITLYFSAAEHLEIPIGAYIDFEGERYSLMRPEALTMQHSRYFEYTVTLEGGQSKMKIWKFKNTVDHRLKFSLTAKPQEHLQMLVDNLNERDSGWSVGSYPESSEKCISYDFAFCWDALGQMADTFETEFQIADKVISLGKVEYNKSEPLALSYGKGNGFKSGVGRSNYNDSPPVEILYAQGGDQNIDSSSDAYGASELHLPKNGVIEYDGEYFEDEDGFDAAKARVYIADEDGYSIQRDDKELSSLAEDSLDCTEIYPKREGAVSSVIVVKEETGEYDFTDDTIPDNLDYNDYIIGGETMSVIFQSGMLAGKEFDVQYFHSDKRFEIVPQEIDGQIMPNKTFAPIIGDTYAIFHCALPQAYINAYDPNAGVYEKTGAEWEMMRECVRYMYENEEENFSFTGTLDGIWAKKNWDAIGSKIILGGYISFSDERFQKENALVRIIGIKDYINKPHSPELELSNAPVSASFSTKLQEISSQEVIVGENQKNADRFTQYTKRNFRDTQETTDMLKAALTNYSTEISPIAVRTMQTIVGDESLQFRFISSLTDETVAYPEFSYNKENGVFTADASYLQHMTLGINSISPTHSRSAYVWELPYKAFTEGTDFEAEKAYYLYAKVEEVSQGGSYALSGTPIAMEAVSGYYHLLIGILNSEYEGERSFVSLYGFTEILPGQITTERIVSTSGTSVFDLSGDILRLGDALKFNVNGDNKLEIDGSGKFSGTLEAASGVFSGVLSGVFTKSIADLTSAQIAANYIVKDEANNRWTFAYGSTPQIINIGAVPSDYTITSDTPIKFPPYYEYNSGTTEKKSRPIAPSEEDYNKALVMYGQIIIIKVSLSSSIWFDALWCDTDNEALLTDPDNGYLLNGAWHFDAGRMYVFELKMNVNGQFVWVIRYTDALDIWKST